MIARDRSRKAKQLGTIIFLVLGTVCFLLAEAICASLALRKASLHLQTPIITLMPWLMIFPVFAAVLGYVRIKGDLLATRSFDHNALLSLCYWLAFVMSAAYTVLVFCMSLVVFAVHSSWH